MKGGFCSMKKAIIAATLAVSVLGFSLPALASTCPYSQAAKAPQTQCTGIKCPAPSQTNGLNQQLSNLLAQLNKCLGTSNCTGSTCQGTINLSGFSNCFKF